MEKVIYYQRIGNDITRLQIESIVRETKSCYITESGAQLLKDSLRIRGLSGVSTVSNVYIEYTEEKYKELKQEINEAKINRALNIIKDKKISLAILKEAVKRLEGKV